MLVVTVLDRIPLVRSARRFFFPTRQELQREHRRIRAQIARITADVTHLEKRHSKDNPFPNRASADTYEQSTSELERIYQGRIELHKLGVQAERLEKRLRRL